MPFLDVRFPIIGSVIPADHGYVLFSAISSLVPEFHSAADIGIHHIAGTFTGNRNLHINKTSCLTIRLPEDMVRIVMPIAGRFLKIGDYGIRLGVPHIRALYPVSSIYSRLVVIKGFMEPEPFLAAARRQLDALGIDGKATLVAQPLLAETNKGGSGGTHSPFLRRTIRIHDREIVGFALTVNDLNDEESLLLQEKGIGGRRRFGCGLFIPSRRY